MGRIEQYRPEKPDYHSGNALLTQGFAALANALNPLQDAMNKAAENEANRQTGLLQQYVATHDPNAPDFQQGLDAIRAQGANWQHPDESKISDAISNRFNQLSQLQTAELQQQGLRTSNALAEKNLGWVDQDHDLDVRGKEADIYGKQLHNVGTNLDNQGKASELQDYQERKQGYEIFSTSFQRLVDNQMSDGEKQQFFANLPPVLVPEALKILQSNKPSGEKSEDFNKLLGTIAKIADVSPAGFGLNGLIPDSLGSPAEVFNSAIGSAAASIQAPNLQPITPASGKTYAVQDGRTLLTNGGDESGSLGDLIHSGESKIKGFDSYDVYNYPSGGEYPAGRKNLNLSKLTVGEVMKLQEDRKVFAAGRYQIVPETMKETVQALDIDPNTPFNKATQDKMFTGYLAKDKRKNLRNYIMGKSNNEHAALVAAAQEWASINLPNGYNAYDKSNNPETKLRGRQKGSIESGEFLNAARQAKRNYALLEQQGYSPDDAYDLALRFNFSADAQPVNQPVPQAVGAATEQPVQVATPANPLVQASEAATGAPRPLTPEQQQAAVLANSTQAPSPLLPQSWANLLSPLPVAPGTSPLRESVPNPPEQPSETETQPTLINPTTPTVIEAENPLWKAVREAEKRAEETNANQLNELAKDEEVLKKMQEQEEKDFYKAIALSDMNARRTAKKEESSPVETENFDKVQYKPKLTQADAKAVDVAIDRHGASTGNRLLSIQEQRAELEAKPNKSEKDEAFLNRLAEREATIVREGIDKTTSGNKLKKVNDEIATLMNTYDKDGSRSEETKNKLAKFEEEAKILKADAQNEFVQAVVAEQKKYDEDLKARMLPREKTKSYQLVQRNNALIQILNRVPSRSEEQARSKEAMKQVLMAQRDTYESQIEAERITGGVTPVETLGEGRVKALDALIKRMGKDDKWFTNLDMQSQADILEEANKLFIEHDKAVQESTDKLETGKVLTLKETQELLRSYRLDPNRVFKDSTKISNSETKLTGTQEAALSKMITMMATKYNQGIKKGRDGIYRQTYDETVLPVGFTEADWRALFERAVSRAASEHDDMRKTTSFGFPSARYEKDYDHTWVNWVSQEQHSVRTQQIFNEEMAAYLQERGEKLNKKLDHILEDRYRDMSGEQILKFIKEQTGTDSKKRKS